MIQAMIPVCGRKRRTSDRVSYRVYHRVSIGYAMTRAMITTSDDWSHQDRVFVALYLEMAKVVPAATQAYGISDPVQASRVGNAFLKANRTVFDLVLEREGLTDSALAKVIVEGMRATKRTYAKHQGEILDHKDDVDHNVRISAAKVGLELKDRINRHKQRADDDRKANAGPVILPVRPGMELPPTSQIIDAEYTEGGDSASIKGGPSEGRHNNPSLNDETHKIEKLASGQIYDASLEEKIEKFEDGDNEEGDW